MLCRYFPHILSIDLCRKFTTQLSDDILFDPEVTLRIIARALSQDGKISPRPYMVETWKLIEFLRTQKQKSSKYPKGIPEQWLQKNKIQANITTHTFPDNCALIKVIRLNFVIKLLGSIDINARQNLSFIYIICMWSLLLSSCPWMDIFLDFTSSLHDYYCGCLLYNNLYHSSGEVYHLILAIIYQME